MTSKPISSKAHSQCIERCTGDFLKPTLFTPILKKNLKKTFKSKQTTVHRRDVSRVQICTVKTLKKHSSCQNLNVIQKDKTIAKCNKSKSYEDIVTSSQAESHICIFRKKSKIMGEERHKSNLKMDMVGNRLIKEACTAFLLNAWRHRRQEVSEIKKKISSLESQTTDLRVQIMSLWQLLESEKARLAQANLKAMQQHVLAEDALVNNKALTTLNANQQKEIAELNKEIQALRTECNNQKNELIVSKQEIFSLHNQMDKERVKVTKLRDDKKILLDKAHAAEAEVKEKSTQLAQSETEQKEKQQAHATLNQNLQEKILEIEELTLEKSKIFSQLDEKVKENESLEKKIFELKIIIEEKEKEIEVLKKTSHGYMVEAVQMRLANLRPEEKDELVQHGGSKVLSLILAIIPLLKAITFP